MTAEPEEASPSPSGSLTEETAREALEAAARAETSPGRIDGRGECARAEVGDGIVGGRPEARAR